nr:glycosyltransferase family 2 protein [Conchiformibius kuhniae]
MIVEHEFVGFGALKNLAAQHARHDWILNIDSDEVISDALAQSLARADFADPAAVYGVCRLNHYRGRAIRGCGWYPDIVPRLYHRRHTAFSDAAVHERIIMRPDSRSVVLAGDLLHYSYEGGAAELIAKMQFYTDLYAREHAGKKSATTAQAAAHGLFAFIKSYVFKKGFLYGGDGWVIATSIAANSYYKYIKLKEANKP